MVVQVDWLRWWGVLFTGAKNLKPGPSGQLQVENYDHRANAGACCSQGAGRVSGFSPLSAAVATCMAPNVKASTW